MPITQHTKDADKRGHDVWTLLGVGVVALAAAVLSFASLRDLAERAGYSPALAALLPLAIDAQAVVATRAWLTSNRDDRAYRYARALALSAVAGSVVGNAGQHAMSAAGVPTPWWVVVAIASVPPVALAATAHLAALLAIHRPTPEQTDQEAAAPEPSGQPETGTALTEHPTEPLTVRSPERAAERPESAQPSAQKTAQSARSKRSRMRSAKGQQRARELFDQHAEAGTLDQLTGSDIATTGGVSPATGRRWLAQWRGEHRPQLAIVGEQHP